MSEEENKTPQENEGKENESQPLDKILDVIGNSTRRLILKKLARFPQTATDPGGMYPGDLAQHLQISKQGVMKHLDLLLNSDLVEWYTRDIENPRGPKPTYYRLTPRARNLLSILEQYDAPEDITRAREKLDQMEVPPEFQEITELERTLLDVDEQLAKVESDRQLLLQQRYEIQCKVQQATDQIVAARFKQFLEEGKVTLNELSLEREILHSFFDNPIQAFLRGFDMDEIFNSLFAEPSFSQRAEWESRILRLLTDKERKEKRFFFFPFEF